MAATRGRDLRGQGDGSVWPPLATFLDGVDSCSDDELAARLRRLFSAAREERRDPVDFLDTLVPRPALAKCWNEVVERVDRTAIARMESASPGDSFRGRQEDFQLWLLQWDRARKLPLAAIVGVAAAAAVLIAGGQVGVALVLLIVGALAILNYARGTQFDDRKARQELKNALVSLHVPVALIGWTLARGTHWRRAQRLLMFEDDVALWLQTAEFAFR